MAKEKSIRLEYHLKFNGRNPRHVKSALALVSVEKRYKSSFIALAIEQYMRTHPMGISIEELLGMYRQSERSYTPKAPITDNLQKIHLNESRVKTLPGVSPLAAGSDKDDAETRNAIDKAMDFYGL